MKDLNHVVLIGRLTRDAELKHLNTGTAICIFFIAVNRSVKRGDKWEDEASFFDVSLFGKQGEAVAQYLTKGQQVAVAGELKQDRWEKDGQKHSRVVIVADTVQLLGGKRDSKPADNLTEDEKYQMAKEFVRETRAGFQDDIPF